MPRSKERLSIAERAALLRAARDRIGQLERELEIWEDRYLRQVDGAQAHRNATRDEWLTLSEAVRKLWLGVTNDG